MQQRARAQTNRVEASLSDSPEHVDGCAEPSPIPTGVEHEDISAGVRRGGQVQIQGLTAKRRGRGGDSWGGCGIAVDVRKSRASGRAEKSRSRKAAEEAIDNAEAEWAPAPHAVTFEARARDFAVESARRTTDPKAGSAFAEDEVGPTSENLSRRYWPSAMT
jgi:hypothetical protein